MRKRSWMAVWIIACIILNLSFPAMAEADGQGFPESLDESRDELRSDLTADESAVPVDYFCYTDSGSSTYEIYSYEVIRDAETGEWKANYELHCGNLPYYLPLTTN